MLAPRKPTPSSALRECVKCAGLGMLLVGCFGGQTGGEFQGEEPGRNPPPFGPTPVGSENGCQETRMPTTLFDGSALGFSGSDVLGFAARQHTASLQWSAMPPAPATFGPESGASSIELGIEYAGGAVRYVVSQPAPTASGAEIGMMCPPPRLEIEVRARVTTAGGALAEEFDTVLTATAPDRAALAHTLAIQSLSGSFFVNVPASFSAKALSIDAQFEPQSFRGKLWGHLEQTVGSGSSGSTGAMAVTYATWLQ